jgi:hypothetical protein
VAPDDSFSVTRRAPRDQRPPVINTARARHTLARFGRINRRIRKVTSRPDVIGTFVAIDSRTALCGRWLPSIIVIGSRSIIVSTFASTSTSTSTTGTRTPRRSLDSTWPPGDLGASRSGNSSVIWRSMDRHPLPGDAPRNPGSARWRRSLLSVPTRRRRDLDHRRRRAERCGSGASGH